MLDDIDKFNLGCRFLVAGFVPSKKYPYIFEIRNPGRYISQSIVGYWAIGSGYINAITDLARRDQKSVVDFGTSLYNAIAVKKLAEKAQGVGPNTIVYVLEAGIEGIKWANESQINEIIKIWENEEAEIRPKNLKERLAELVDHDKISTSRRASKKSTSEKPGSEPAMQ